MQITNSYATLDNIGGVQSTSGLRRTTAHSGRSTGDTVSISDEAISAYRNSCSPALEPTGDEMSDTATKFRQALEEAWNAEGSEEDTSLMGRLRSAFTFWRT